MKKIILLSFVFLFSSTAYTNGKKSNNEKKRSSDKESSEQKKQKNPRPEDALSQRNSPQIDVYSSPQNLIDIPVINIPALLNPPLLQVQNRENLVDRMRNIDNIRRVSMNEDSFELRYHGIYYVTQILQETGIDPQDPRFNTQQIIEISEELFQALIQITEDTHDIRNELGPNASEAYIPPSALLV